MYCTIKPEDVSLPEQAQLQDVQLKVPLGLGGSSGISSKLIW